VLYSAAGPETKWRVVRIAGWICACRHARASAKEMARALVQAPGRPTLKTLDDVGHRFRVSGRPRAPHDRRAGPPQSLRLRGRRVAGRSRGAVLAEGPRRARGGRACRQSSQACLAERRAWRPDAPRRAHRPRRARTPAADDVSRLSAVPGETDARALRARLLAEMAAAEVPEERAHNMLIAWRGPGQRAPHGGGARALRIGRVGSQFVCEISDHGAGLDDLLAGYLPPHSGHARGAVGRPPDDAPRRHGVFIPRPDDAALDRKPEAAPRALCRRRPWPWVRFAPRGGSSS
jgi:hypothetical protein